MMVSYIYIYIYVTLHGRCTLSITLTPSVIIKKSMSNSFYSVLITKIDFLIVSPCFFPLIILRNNLSFKNSAVKSVKAKPFRDRGKFRFRYFPVWLYGFSSEQDYETFPFKTGFCYRYYPFSRVLLHIY